MNIADYLRRSASTYPAATALYRDDVPVASYAQLWQQSLQAATLLRRLGLNRGDRVAILADNHPAWLAALFGAWCAGLAVVPINARLHPREAAVILEDSGARLVLCCPRWAGLLEGSAGPQVLAFADLEQDAAREDPAVPVSLSGDELAWLFYTSGTTGTPKGAMLTHENLRQMALNFLADVHQPGPAARLVHFAPMSHGSGLYAIPWVVAGAASVVPVHASFRSADCIPLLNRHRNACMFMAPTMVRMLAERPDIGELAPGSLDLIVYGGAPMPVADVHHAACALGPCFAQIYGQGESPMTISRLPQPMLERAVCEEDADTLVSAGWPFSGVEVRVLDESETEAPAGEVGEVVVRGPVVMAGYWKRPEATGAQISDGWLRTGDLGSFDEAGRLTLKGRSRDLVISGGMNIYPVEVENVLCAHPLVAEAAVIGAPDPEWGERMVAFVVLREESDRAAAVLDAHCLDRIARFKRPREYRFVSELPKNNYGKVLKRELRDQALAGIESQQETSHG